MHVEAGERRGIPLHTRIMIGLALGALAGVLTNRFAAGAPWVANVIEYVAQPVGQIFLRMLFMVVIPLVFTTLALGVAGLGDLRKVGRVGGKTMLFFLFTTAVAAMLGLFLANTVQPGGGIDAGLRDSLIAQYSTDASARIAAQQTGGFGINTFINIVPRNVVDSAARTDLLGVIFFALMFGIALTRIPESLSKPVMVFLEGVATAIIAIIGFAMKLAPYGVAGLIFTVTATFGTDVLRALAMYVVMVLAGLIIHQFVTLGLIARFLGGIPWRTFYSRARFMMITAFSTSSSNATLPTTLRTSEEEFGVPRQIAGFVIPLGATMNMNGTALFEGMTVLFLAQVFGMDLSIGTQLIVIVMCVITAIGAAGVPGGSIPLLVGVLIMVGIPGEAIGLILGVDRILDMSRTVPNVTGDLLATIVIARSEGYELKPATAPDFSTDAAVEALQHEHEVERDRHV